MAPREILEKRLERARATLDTYAAYAKYPPGARPMSEEPDQGEPHSVATQKLPLAREDKKLTDAHVTLRQDRYYLTGDEQVTLAIECETSDGPAACEILSSIATSASGQGEAPRVAVVTFSGQDPGGPLTAVFAPQTQGFEGYYGSIHINLDLRVEGETGRTGFDIEYTPTPPAVFTGAVREVIEDGSLSLYIGIDTAKAGRYVLQARVDDAKGRSFALLSFNDELPRGSVEAKFVLFGKLILDESAEAPFRLRGLEGFLLKEDTTPDRELMPGKDGTFYTTKPYTRRDFSDSEWQSEEKDRYLSELHKNVDKAARALDANDKP